MSLMSSHFPIHVMDGAVRFGNSGPTVWASDLRHQSVSQENLDLMINGWHQFAAEKGLSAVHPLVPMMFEPREGLRVKTVTPWFQDNEHGEFEIPLFSAWDAAKGRSLGIKPGDQLLLTRPGVFPFRVLVKTLRQ